MPYESTSSNQTSLSKVGKFQVVYDARQQKRAYINKLMECLDRVQTSVETLRKDVEILSIKLTKTTKLSKQKRYGDFITKANHLLAQHNQTTATLIDTIERLQEADNIISSKIGLFYKFRIDRAQTKINIINQYLQKEADSQMKLEKFCIELKEKLDTPNLSLEQKNHCENALKGALEEMETLSRLTEENTSKLLNLTAKIIDNQHKLAIVDSEYTFKI